jgi:hypothetical protein
LVYQERFFALRTQRHKISIAVVFRLDVVRWTYRGAAEASMSGADDSGLDLDVTGWAKDIE